MRHKSRAPTHLLLPIVLCPSLAAAAPSSLSWPGSLSVDGVIETTAGTRARFTQGLEAALGEVLVFGLDASITYRSEFQGELAARVGYDAGDLFLEGGLVTSLDGPYAYLSGSRDFPMEVLSILKVSATLSSTPDLTLESHLDVALLAVLSCRVGATVVVSATGATVQASAGVLLHW